MSTAERKLKKFHFIVLPTFGLICCSKKVTAICVIKKTGLASHIDHDCRYYIALLTGKT